MKRKEIEDSAKGRVFEVCRREWFDVSVIAWSVLLSLEE